MCTDFLGPHGPNINIVCRRSNLTNNHFIVPPSQKLSVLCKCKNQTAADLI